MERNLSELIAEFVARWFDPTVVTTQERIEQLDKQKREVERLERQKRMDCRRTDCTKWLKRSGACNLFCEYVKDTRTLSQKAKEWVDDSDFSYGITACSGYVPNASAAILSPGRFVNIFNTGTAMGMTLKEKMKADNKRHKDLMERIKKMEAAYAPEKQRGDVRDVRGNKKSAKKSKGKKKG